MADADREELRRYREEEERGLLLRLPVPLGAAVWRVRENPACHYGVRQAEIFLFGEVVTPRRIVEETPFTLRRSYRGKVSRCQGAFFEQMISAACNLYRERQIADIEKTPEPMQPTKDLGGGKFIAHYTGKGQADYKGFLWGGRAVNFEAKYTDSGKMMQDRVTKDQAERLERAQQYGGVAFVLCSFGSVAFYRIPWVVWRDMKGNFGRKYIMPADVEQYRVKIGAPGVPLFLEGLEAQSAEREEHS